LLTTSANSAGFSKYMAWPQSLTSAYRAPGMRSAYRFACWAGMTRSSSGATTRAGAVIRRRRRSSFGFAMNGFQQKRARAVESR
jgi:hypothetical protein